MGRLTWPPAGRSTWPLTLVRTTKKQMTQAALPRASRMGFECLVGLGKADCGCSGGQRLRR